MRKYQLVNRIDNIERYCSVIYVYNNPLVFMGKDRQKAMVYTEKEHFENCGIYVMEKEVLISHKKTFDFKNDARL